MPRLAAHRESHSSRLGSSPWKDNESCATTKPSFQFSSAPVESIVFFAPLIYECLDNDTRHELVVLIALLYSPKTRAKTDDGRLDDELASYLVDPTSPHQRLSLMKRLNGYLELEGNLWRLAKEGGFPDPPPYAVRYETARWLWSPAVSGSAFCLRCGMELWFKRAERREGARTLRCGPCSRGLPSDWPAHALAPHDRGTWWIACQHQGCGNAFIGYAQARFCPKHRASLLTRTRRRDPASLR